MRQTGWFNKQTGKMEWYTHGKAPVKPRKAIPYANGLVSTAMGCHPTQVEEANKILTEKGIKDAHYQPDGFVKFESRSGRRDFCKAMGIYDADAGYGDWSGR